MYLVEASVCPKILRAGQAVLPLEPSTTHPVGLPGSSRIQIMVTCGRGHSCRAGGRGAPAGQSLFPVVDQLPKGQGNHWSCHLITPRIVTCSLWNAWVPHSPDPPQLPYAPPHSALPPALPPRATPPNVLTGRCPPPLPLTGGLHAAPGCICHHPAWLHCVQPRWPGQWLGGHPAPGPGWGSRGRQLELGQTEDHNS